MSNFEQVIAVDGPSGSGKSTVAKLVAEKLSITYIDTGSMFRAFGYALKDLPINWEQSELDFQSEQLIEKFLKDHSFKYAPTKDVLIKFDDQNLTDIIRQHDVSALASRVSRFKVIRSFLAHWQKEIVANKPAILDGRDIGTVIFPKAKLKIFLTASAEERAKRRYEELLTRNDKHADYHNILSDIKERDLQDIQRVIAPLKKAHDAIEIDTTHKTLSEIVEYICSEWKKRNFDETH
jgi:cytidylate kinase